MTTVYVSGFVTAEGKTFYATMVTVRGQSMVDLSWCKYGFEDPQQAFNAALFLAETLTAHKVARIFVEKATF